MYILYDKLVLTKVFQAVSSQKILITIKECEWYTVDTLEQ